MTRFLAAGSLSLVLALAGCGGSEFGGGSTSAAGGSGSGGSGTGGSTGGGDADAACRTFSSWSKLDASSCTTCINEECKAGHIVTVCGSNPADECNTNCGTDTTCFCMCMTSRSGACGVTVGEAYKCFADKCGDACN